MPGTNFRQKRIYSVLPVELTNSARNAALALEEESILRREGLGLGMDGKGLFVEFQHLLGRSGNQVEGVVRRGGARGRRKVIVTTDYMSNHSNPQMLWSEVNIVFIERSRPLSAPALSSLTLFVSIVLVDHDEVAALAPSLLLNSLKESLMGVGEGVLAVHEHMNLENVDVIRIRNVAAREELRILQHELLPEVRPGSFDLRVEHFQKIRSRRREGKRPRLERADDLYGLVKPKQVRGRRDGEELLQHEHKRQRLNRHTLDGLWRHPKLVVKGCEDLEYLMEDLLGGNGRRRRALRLRVTTGEEILKEREEKRELLVNVFEGIGWLDILGRAGLDPRHREPHGQRQGHKGSTVNDHGDDADFIGRFFVLVQRT
mmetsp:Transcript_23304/g.48464  ORF Transcript_23304/g.48464 Transcript_23304/m.48464 type:complete len:373 (-) Transcript_23304:709-1827(-)